MKTDKEKLEIAKKALAVYVRRYEDDGSCWWNWSTTSDDDFNYHTFDYKGDEQQEPWEIAEKALKELEE